MPKTLGLGLLSLVLILGGLHPWNLWWLSWAAFIPLFYVAFTAPRAHILILSAGIGFIYCAYGLAGILSYEESIFFMSLASSAPLLALFFFLYLKISARAKSQSTWLLCAPVIWIALQKLLSFTPIGTISTGILFRGPLAFLQLTPIMGPHFHEALILGLNAALAAQWAGITRNAKWVFFFISLLLITGLYGSAVLRQKSVPDKKIRAVLIQHNLNAEVDWRLENIEEIRRVYRESAAEAGKIDSDLVIFPLYDIDDDVWRKPELFADIPPLAKSPVLLSTYIRTQDTGDYDFYDMALLFNEDGALKDTYHAIAPPPFRKIGEQRANVYKTIKSPVGILGIFLCYENALSRMAEKAVQHGAEILISLSNPVFFNHTGIPYYHFAQSQLRALESGRYVIQLSESGHSGVIDSRGRIISQSKLGEKKIFPVEAGLLPGKTIYHQFDFLGWFSLIALAVLAGLKSKQPSI